MGFPDYFADAEASFNEADFIIVGVPYDKTSAFRKGAHKAPTEIRQASWNFESYDLRTGVDLQDLKVHDYGDLPVKNLAPQEMVQQVHKTVTQILEHHKFPILIGGEHSTTIGAVHSFPKNIGVVSLDAHLDYRDTYEDERLCHACVTRRITDHVSSDNIAVFGLRSAERAEYEQAQKTGCSPSTWIRYVKKASPQRSMKPSDISKINRSI